MANHSLAHIDAHLYHIHFKDLEIIHHKLIQAMSQLSLLSDWISVTDLCALSRAQNGNLEGCLHAVLSLLKEALKVLPEL